MQMPVGLQWLYWIAGGVVAFGTIWRVVLVPAGRRGKNVAKLVAAVAGLPEAVAELAKALKEVAKLSEATKKVAETADNISRESVKMIEVQRIAFENFEKYAQVRSDKLNDALTKLLTRADLSGAMIQQMRAGDIVVADDLAQAKKAVEGVASDLVESSKQADAVPEDAPPGSAADAAAKTVNGNGGKV